MMPQKNIHCEILIVGSGPGGATTACLLARAGKDVLLVEEGGHFSVADAAAYSLKEMDLKYRHAGMTVAFGKPTVAYLEACCVGGASEVNAGLYHYPFAEVLENWQAGFQIKEFGLRELEPFFRDGEQDIAVTKMPAGVGPASRKILEGADQLNWKAAEVPRCWKYLKEPSGKTKQVRQSMTETMIPKAIQAGCRLLARTKVRYLKLNRRAALFAVADSFNSDGQKVRLKIFFKNVFVCAGAIQTPALLRRSGIKRHIGDSLRMHPAIRVVALFKDQMHDNTEGVPVVQIQEFKPRLTLGGSYSALPHLALWLSGQRDVGKKLSLWKNMAIFYALIVGTGKGTVRNIPFLEDPWIAMPLTEKDRSAFGDGLFRLGQLLLAAGATEIYSPIAGGPSIKNRADLGSLKQVLPQSGVDISTIHLFSSCPMGEDFKQCAVDSFGKVHGFDNVYLNDASILSGAPGANPQALIMAVARRNAQKFLENEPTGSL